MSLKRAHGRASRLLRDQEGSALIEFTLMAPLLFSLVLGIAEFGRLLYQYQMVL